jgi:DNA polymerase III delta prime subunit
MLRLARATRAELEDVVDRVTRGLSILDEVAYPDGCDPARGPLRIELHHRGGLILRVTPGTIEADDFRLACLFELGACVFGSIDDLHGFCAGALARAFGLSVRSGTTSATRDIPRLADAALEPSAHQLPLVDVLVEEARAARDRRAVTAATLAKRLAEEIKGQDAALERIASVVAGQLAKRHPVRPGSVLLLGPTGVGKTATIEALPAALRDLGCAGAHVHRIDCSELADDIHLTRVLGVGPGYAGHGGSTALLDALRRRGVIVLLDEIEKAHPDLRDALLALLDTGTLTDPSGAQVGCAHAIVALTSNLGWSDLADRLGTTPLHDRVGVARICRAHLVERGLRPELVGRIGAIAVYGELDEDARRGAALSAVRLLAREYEVVIDDVDPTVLDVVLDLAEASGAGARGLYHAARDVLAECLADVAGERRGSTWSIAVGPPPVLVPG